MKKPLVPIRDDRSEFPSVDRAPFFLGMLEDFGVDFRGKRIVDLGAGFGTIAMALARSGSDVAAIDAGERQLDELKRRALNDGIELQVYSGNLISDALPVTDVDLALLVGVVEYAGMWSDTEPVEQLQVKVLKTALNTLRPGGTLVLCTKNRIWPVFAFRDVHTKLPLVNVLPRPIAEKLARRLTGEPYRLYIHSPKKWQSLLHEAGFERSEVAYPYFSYQYPVGISQKPAIRDFMKLQEPNDAPSLAYITHGRFWKLKAVAMGLAHSIGVPFSNSVVIKATK